MALKRTKDLIISNWSVPPEKRDRIKLIGKGEKDKKMKNKKGNIRKLNINSSRLIITKIGVLERKEKMERRKNIKEIYKKIHIGRF
jgi:hypothetical protein